jgi:hypothetical protein
VLDTLVDSLFILDVLLTFRTEISEKNGGICTDGRVIARSYIKGWFFVDFISAIPLDKLVELVLGSNTSDEVRFISIFLSVPFASSDFGSFSRQNFRFCVFGRKTHIVLSLFYEYFSC